MIKYDNKANKTKLAKKSKRIPQADIPTKVQNASQSNSITRQHNDSNDHTKETHREKENVTSKLYSTETKRAREEKRKRKEKKNERRKKCQVENIYTMNILTDDFI